MRQEILNWFKQAEADLRKSSVLLDANEFDGSVFYSQQAVEKALKALCLFKFREIPHGHSIIYLAQKTRLIKDLISGVRDLNPEYLTTRYPDIAAGVPAELYDINIATRHKKTADGVMKWVRNQIQK